VLQFGEKAPTRSHIVASLMNAESVFVRNHSAQHDRDGIVRHALGASISRTMFSMMADSVKSCAPNAIRHRCNPRQFGTN
jgi:hypothetical protein